MNDEAQAKFSYPEELPISVHRDEIMSLMRRHPVVIVCGDTGSGKTTQIPKMAMELGRGAGGRLIACTQPRRLAAVTVAERVAKELGESAGGTIGYQHRFAKEVSDRTRVKFMTDGVLLAETRSDPLLGKYDTIIVDEAHERTLNVDFLLGILKRILSRRRDLKVVVSSATLDTGLFSRFFDDAPAINVPGRLFPIETRYAFHDDSGDEDFDVDLPHAVGSALKTLPADHDTLVFLPGERDIRETADHLARVTEFARDDIIPLLASLPSGEQRRAFEPSPRRRVILATNVAETSVTIPGIRAVIDSGLARISRYVHRTQVQRLQIEPVSKASARQRAGRCGRLGPGTCIRLFSEGDFEKRDEYTPPEILRSSLAGVILTMLDLRLGDIEDFPFVEPPKPSMIREGLRELVELGAIRHDESHNTALTKIGRALARLPIQPRLARMLLAASENGSLDAAIPVVAAMSCDDPRRRPVDEREKADQAHAKFRVRGSDFLGTLKLWKWWDEESKTLSQSQLRKLAKKSYLSYPKMREWRDVVRQLTDLCRRLKLYFGGDGSPDSLHRALISGLLARLGHIDPERPEYRGAHGLRFAIHPGSVLAKEKKVHPEWIMAGELVDTSRLFARNAAVVDPSWIESVAGNLVKRSYRDPFWDAEAGFVRATEQVTLYGLVIVPARRRNFSRIDPAKSREIFIRHALVMGEIKGKNRELRENLRLVAELQKLADRLRRPELFDTDRLAAHFDAAIPPDIVSAGDLNKWLYAASQSELSRFRLKRSEWLPSTSPTSDAFPPSIRLANAKISLYYRHAPDDPDTDGITASVRKSDAPALKLWRADWLVPGALPEKVSFLLNSLPSVLRRVLAPISDTVAVILPLLTGRSESLEEAMRLTIEKRFGIHIPVDAFDRIALPPHLRVRFAIRDDEGGRTLAVSRDLDEALEKAEVTETPDYGKFVRGGGLGKRQQLHVDSRVAALAHEGEVTGIIAGTLYPNRQQDDATLVAIREAALRGRPPILSEDDLEKRIAATRRGISSLRQRLQSDVKAIETAIQELLRSAESLAQDIYDSIETQLAYLTFPGWVRLVPYERLADYPRYLKALKIRIDRARVSPSSDRAKDARIEPYWTQYVKLISSKSAKVADRAALVEYRWLVEEYRISLFAQEVGTRAKASPVTLSTLWLKATGG